MAFALSSRELQVMELKEQEGENFRLRPAARKLGIHVETVRQILKRVEWRRKVLKQLPILGVSEVNKATITKLRTLLMRGFSLEEIISLPDRDLRFMLNTLHMGLKTLLRLRTLVAVILATPVIRRDEVLRLLGLEHKPPDGQTEYLEQLKQHWT